MDKNNKDFKEKFPNEEMGLSHWERVLSGASGGALIVGGFWLYSNLIPTQKWLAFIPMILGIIAIFYGRKG